LAAVAAALRLLGKLPGDGFLAVNVSPGTAGSEELASLVATCPGERLVLEITEHVPVGNYEELVTALDRLRTTGVRIAVDDAGAGFAGLHHILRLGPEIIKLDIGLTRGIDADPVRRALASALVSFAREIGAIIVAEGIESGPEAATLADLGVVHGQGYFLAWPSAAPDLTRSVTPIDRGIDRR